MTLEAHPVPDSDIAPSSWTAEIGLVAVGGELTPQRVLAAYSRGIFPWPLLGEGEPVLWCSPDPRFVLFPENLHIPRSLARDIRRRPVEIRFDTAFEEVMRQCARAERPGQSGTWITEPMVHVYTVLHRQGFAHSVEAWNGDRLVGGLYGIALGRAFFGESMFTLEPNASKIAFVRLVEHLGVNGYMIVDCQQRTDHLERFGADDIPRERFVDYLEVALTAPATSTAAWPTGPVSEGPGEAALPVESG